MLLLLKTIPYFVDADRINPKLPSVYTVEILDFAGQKDEYVQMLYDRTPTLPQRLRFGDEYIRNLWTNLGWRIFRA